MPTYWATGAAITPSALFKQGGFIQPLENIEALRHFVGAWQSKSPYRQPKSTLLNFLLINETTLPP